MSAPVRSCSLRRRQNSAASAGLLYIFQLPAISAKVARSYGAAGITLTPGRSLPSRSSNAAPPPVESHETLSASPSSASARAESAPPTTEYPSEAATACATAFVPSAKGGHSKTPMGPFQIGRAHV